jgi:hypothetical protein
LRPQIADRLLKSKYGVALERRTLIIKQLLSLCLLGFAFPASHQPLAKQDLDR